MNQQMTTDGNSAREQTSRGRESGCIFVAIREGFFEEVSFQLRTEGNRRTRHEKSKRVRGDLGCRDSVQCTAHEEGSCGQGARLPHGSCKPVPAATCPSCLPPTLPLSFASLPSRQLQMSRSDLGPCDHSLVLGAQGRQHMSCGTCQAEKGCVKRGDWGRGHPEQPSQASCIPEGRACGILIWPPCPHISL